MTEAPLSGAPHARIDPVKVRRVEARAHYRWRGDGASTVALDASAAIACEDGVLPDEGQDGVGYRLIDVAIGAAGAPSDLADAGWHFAHESLIDELREAVAQAGTPVTPTGPASRAVADRDGRDARDRSMPGPATSDPIAWRGALLDPVEEAGGKVLLRALAERSGPANASMDGRGTRDAAGYVVGRGVGYATLRNDVAGVDGAVDRSIRSEVDDHAAPSYVAWIVDLAFDSRTGDMQLRRVVAGRAKGTPPAHGADGTFRIEGFTEALVSQALRGLVNSMGRSVPLLSVPFDESIGSTPWIRTAMSAGGVRALHPHSSTRSAVTLSGPAALLDDATPCNGGGTPAWQRIASGLAAAAVANAVFAVTGRRQRSMPAAFSDLDVAVRAQTAAPQPEDAVHARAPLQHAATHSVDTQASRDIGVMARVDRRWIGGLLATAGAMVVGALSWQALVSDGALRLLGPLRPFRSEIARVAPPPLDTWSAATIERGRRLAAAADCAVCHTAEGAVTNTGGRPFDTPFGVVYSTNLTPDVKDGIGGWSFVAFERALREGISRDGRHLYPVFPYTAFNKITDADMMALYAFLMTRPAERTPAELAGRHTVLGFPWRVRPLLAAWNTLYLNNKPFLPDPSRGAEWSRGAYLVEALGHCGACHTPRNALGAERSGPGGKAYLSGGDADGWRAPALIGRGDAPKAWTESALFDYLRVGFSPEHGVAAGPMAPVVRNLNTLPDADIRAIAHYIASWRDDSKPSRATIDPSTTSAPIRRQAGTIVASSPMASEAAVERSATTTLATPTDRVRPSRTMVSHAALQSGKRVFEAACAVCHVPQTGVGHFGVRPEMHLNSSIQADSPDNLLRVILAGIDVPATPELGFMPGFADAYDDTQIAALAGYLRAEHAPTRGAWTDLRAASARVRAALIHEHATR
ncbi:nicotinate dehydrogenase subunit B [Robbsia andropogonis]|uniref:cytochrome c n=1 Tax=Robbsia andropogonis TaxID=28092 RepID=UPI003D1D2CED